MNSSLHLQPRTFPARVAELGFTTQLPADWISHELPPEDVDFSDPTNLLPLGVVTAPHAAIILETPRGSREAKEFGSEPEAQS